MKGRRLQKSESFWLGWEFYSNIEVLIASSCLFISEVSLLDLFFISSRKRFIKKMSKNRIKIAIKYKKDFTDP